MPTSKKQGRAEREKKKWKLKRQTLHHTGAKHPDIYNITRLFLTKQVQNVMWIATPKRFSLKEMINIFFKSKVRSWNLKAIRWPIFQANTRADQECVPGNPSSGSTSPGPLPILELSIPMCKAWSCDRSCSMSLSLLSRVIWSSIRIWLSSAICCKKIY